MVIEKEDKFVNVLFGKFQGWVILEDWLKIEKADH